MTAHQQADGSSPRRRLTPEARRAELLSAAADLFTANGSTFTASQVATAAGVSEGTIFRYFPDMSSLVAEARHHAMGMHTLLPQLESASQHAVLEDRLRAAGAAIVARMTQTVRLFEDTSAPLKRPQPAEVAVVVHALATLFEEGAEGDPSELSMQLGGLFLGLFASNTILSRATGTQPLDVEALVAIFVRGAMPSSGDRIED